MNPAAGFMIAKPFFLAKVIHRILIQSFRDKKSLLENPVDYRAFFALRQLDEPFRIILQVPGKDYGRPLTGETALVITRFARIAAKAAERSEKRSPRMHGDTTAFHDMSLRELSHWAEGQAKRLAANFGLDSATGSDNAYFALAQTVKLGEEVGESHAEVLGALKYHRTDKEGQYGSDTLGGELADVMVCLALLAQILDVDLTRAVSAKIDHLEARNRR